jgi:hypothetical protein
MNRKVCWSILAVIFLIGLTSCSSSSKKTPPAVAIAATSGSGQSATVGTAFATLGATVTTGGTPTAGASVTFTAPSSGASCTFANSTNTETDTANASGVATSSVCTANTTAGAYSVMATTTGATAAASFSLTNTAGAAAAIAATGGNNQSVAVGATYSTLTAQVTDSDGNGVSGVSVTFTANTGATGASGTFTSTTSNTESVPTDTSGNATVSDLVANATTGAFTVTADFVGDTGSPATFNETNIVAPVASNYVFYLSGEEQINGGPNIVDIAGTVTIDSTGNVLGGEQDYNDAFGITSPQPSGDTITGGTLTVDGTTGHRTLTLITNNTSVGVSGTETFGVQFVNTNHALIMQFDGTATSSGSMDLQTLAGPSGAYSFTFTGVDTTYSPVAVGGVFSISGTALTGGTFDVNDAGTVSTGNPFTGNVSAADSFGRGSITGAFVDNGTPVVLSYYIVGPEVIRIIVVDTNDSAVGSAFGQGAGSFTNASLGSSVMAVAGNPFQSQYGALGQFTTNTAAATFSGVGDDNELDVPFLSALASPISGTYSIASNGYGSLTISGGFGGGDVSALGMYMTDPALNLNDPNNPTGGGGALVLDLDAVLAGGTGVLIPQTDSTAMSFTGSTNSYAVGWQDFNDFSSCFDCELDFLALGTVAGGTLSGTGSIGDPFLTLSSSATDSLVTFTGTPLADATNAGRYSMLSTNTPANPLTFTVNGTAQTPGLVMYQASGAQLFWLNYDTSDLSVFVGPLEQQGSLTGLPAARRPVAKTQTKRKH